MQTSVASSAAASRPDRGGSALSPWRPGADRLQGILSAAVLSGASLLCIAAPSIEAALRHWSGALLLLGGAFIGVPHGTSDVLVAHRLMRPACGRGWLPVFLALYIAMVAAALAAWSAVPLAALTGFLVLSALHFGQGDTRANGGSRLLFAVRATTPVLPIFLIHPAGVAGLLAALAGVSEPATLHLLGALRLPLLPLWAAALALVALPPLLAGGRRAGEAAELLSVALAAAVLPPLAAFTLYFCLVHAVRHLLEIGEEHHPGRPGAAAALAAAIVVPSALVCLAALAVAWDGLSGILDTDAVVIWGLRIVAALTVPHMALEWVATRRSQPGESIGVRPGPIAVRCRSADCQMVVRRRRHP